MLKTEKIMGSYVLSWHANDDVDHRAQAFDNKPSLLAHGLEGTIPESKVLVFEEFHVADGVTKP